MIEIPKISIRRGGIDFNTVRPAPAPSPAVDHEHVWGRESNQSQCGCGQCQVPDPRALGCDACSARMKPGDEGFDELYEASPWWFDIS